MENFNKEGNVFAFKTDTVWGFGAKPEDKIGVEKIYEIKKRDRKKPLILMSNDFIHLKKYIKKIPDYAYSLIEKYLPGGLTLIFEKSEICPDWVSLNLNTIGIRIPNSKDFFNLVEKIDGHVLATTSCNISNEPPVKNYLEANELFSSKAIILKPESEKENLNISPSTIILCSENGFKILRQGDLSLEDEKYFLG